MTNEEKKVISVNVDYAVIRKLKRANMNVSQLIRHLLKQFTESKKFKKIQDNLYEYFDDYKSINKNNNNDDDLEPEADENLNF